MKIYKFGGASLKDADGVRNVAQIISQYAPSNAVIVVSAMGKTTNALEEVVQAYLYDKPKLTEKMKAVEDYHLNIISTLFPHQNSPIYTQISTLWKEMWSFMQQNRSTQHGYVYDQIVSYGELLSSIILSHYLQEKAGIAHRWIDVRQYIKTNSFYREAEVDWQTTAKNIATLKNHKATYITQGFLGSDQNNFSTTLGREGSDYSAAIFAYCLHAQEVSIWKDVQGVLNADPRYFPEPILLHQIPYQEAIELAFYGASVIHPKTLQPLQKAGITLWVRSFIDPQKQGTAVCNVPELSPKVPCFILKENQHLLALSSRDFSFISEENISHIFRMLSQNKIKANLIQNSAISFRICVEDKFNNIGQLLHDLEEKFSIEIIQNLRLYTIRAATPQALQSIAQGKEILLQQEFDHTVQIITKK